MGFPGPNGSTPILLHQTRAYVFNTDLFQDGRVKGLYCKSSRTPVTMPNVGELKRMVASMVPP